MVVMTTPLTVHLPFNRDILGQDFLPAKRGDTPAKTEGHWILVQGQNLLVVADDIALYVGRWTLQGADPAGQPVSMGGESSDVLRRQPDGRWLIALDNPWGAAILQPR